MADKDRDVYRERRPEATEENRAQRQSDAANDAGAGLAGEVVRGGAPPVDQRSTANGVSADDETDGELRKKQYRDGAEIVSGMD